jgi:undecaprenyl-diphosphatase
MQLLDAILLGLTQGLTEFIPVSSSGHLILVGHFLHFQYSGLAFDTALDIGTLAALYLFFARDFYQLGHDLILGGPHRKLAWYILLGTVPAVVAGVLVEKLAETTFRHGPVVALSLIWVGVVMLFVDRYAQQRRDIEHVTWPRALAIGAAQAVALIPGTSRSGITITASRAMGFDRVSATIITGATLKVLAHKETVHQMLSVPVLYGAGILAAFVSGYLSIRFLLQYLSKHGLGVFAVYRIVLGVIILAVGVS